MTPVQKRSAASRKGAKRKKHQRTLAIEAAIRDAKKRDGLPDSDGAHLLPRNVGFPRYNPADMDFIVCLPRGLHQEFDTHKRPLARAEWLRAHGFHFAALMVLWAVGEIHERPKRWPGEGAFSKYKGPVHEAV